MSGSGGNSFSLNSETKTIEKRHGIEYPIDFIDEISTEEVPWKTHCLDEVEKVFHSFHIKYNGIEQKKGSTTMLFYYEKDVEIPVALSGTGERTVRRKIERTVVGKWDRIIDELWIKKMN